MIDPQSLVLWLSIASMAISVFSSVIVFVTSGSKKNADKLHLQEKKLIDHDRRVQALESEMKHLPDRETTHRIEISMTQIIGRLDAQDATLAGKFTAMEETLKPIQAIGERLNDVLLEQARK